MKNVLMAAVAVTALFASVPAMAQDLTPTFRVCTGGTKGKYFEVANLIASNARKGAVQFDVINTAGSWENLKKLSSGECDAAFVQSDAARVYAKENPGSKLDFELTAALYPEYVHLVCNRNTEADSIKDLPSDTKVAVGKPGSGSSVTLKGFALADDNYTTFVPVPLDGNRALAKVVEGTDAQCTLFVAGLGSASMMKVEDEGAKTEALKLLTVDDWDFDDEVDDKGNSIYQDATIPGGTYDSLQDGTFGSSVDTVAVTAQLVTNVSWIDENSDAYDEVLEAVSNSRQAIAEATGQ